MEKSLNFRVSSSSAETEDARRRELAVETKKKDGEGFSEILHIFKEAFDMVDITKVFRK